MSEKSRIIVDEDWKAQVEREREVARQQAVAPSAEEEMEIPAASLTLLISMFATEALIALGQIRHPAAEGIMVDLPQAKHLVDLLQVLEDKTAGNRTPEETAMLSQLLHELRLAYVAVQKHLEAPGKPASP